MQDGTSVAQIARCAQRRGERADPRSVARIAQYAQRRGKSRAGPNKRGTDSQERKRKKGEKGRPEKTWPR